MDIPILGGAYEYRSKNVNAQVCENFFFLIDTEGGKPISMVNTPGSKLFCNLNKVAEVRGLWEFNDSLYVVCGDTVYKVSSNGNATSIGTIGTSSGPVSMTDNGTQICLVDGSTTGYLIKSDALSEISDEDFPGANLVTFQDGYFIINQPNTDYFWISGLNDGDSWSALDVGVAEFNPDATLSVLADHAELLCFGKKTTEPFQNTGDNDFPFERITPGLMEMGCGAGFSPSKNDNSVFWLNERDQIVRADGYTPKFISTRQVDYQISTYSSVSDARGFSFVLEGHSFYCLTFPDATWLYNAATNLWSKWTSYPNYRRHRANCYAKLGRKHIIGDYENGRLYELDMETYTDNSEMIKRIRTTSSIKGKNGKKIVYPRIELYFEGGVGLPGNVQGSDPKVMFDYSDDGGKVWSNRKTGDLGKIGVRKNKAVWTQNGRSEDRIFRWIITDPVKTVITGASAPGAYLER